MTGRRTYLGKELEGLDLVFIIPGIPSELDPFLLSALIRRCLLLGSQPIHLPQELLLDDLAVAHQTGADRLGQCRHELRVLEIVVPVELGDLVDGLVEGSEDVDDGNTMALVVARGLIGMFGADGEEVLLDRLLDPIHDLLVGHADPAPDKLGKQSFDGESKGDADMVQTQREQQMVRTLT